MTWMLWVLAALVVGSCVVVAVGRGGAMKDVYDDRPDVLVPDDRPLGADDLRAVRFTTAVRGYRMAEVDALLARLATELEALDPGPAPSLHRHPDAPRPDGADVTAVTRHEVTRRGDEGDRAG